MLLLITISSLILIPSQALYGDESNVVIPACRLSNATNSTGVVVADKHREWFKNCIQGIIQFIIVLAVLVTILKLAFDGVNMLDPTSYKDKINSRQQITNLVIGLFLLLIGWNLIPIMNLSLGNVNFLQLPQN